MRIISGEHKGRRILPQKNLPVRPTTDRAKEALFNILNNHFYFDDISVLDLFAGTGNISYEFASRGCKQIKCVDTHANCLQFIQQTSSALNLSIKTIKSDVFKFLQTEKEKVTLIFADPPYHFTSAQFLTLVTLVFENELLLEDGFFILEHASQNDLSTLPNFSFSKKYGNSNFSFFR